LSDLHQGPDPDNPIDPTIAAIVRRKACRLVGRAGLQAQDREDIEQQLVVHILEQLDRFDPARGEWPAFVQRLVERFGRNLVRSLRAAKRRGPPLAPLPDEGPGRDPAATAAALDLAAALAKLPEDLRAVAELLTTETVSDAARILGHARSTVHARIRELRSRSELKALLRDP
jgi:DNA-directed RNA polymerase specialized sigma24 family protein